MPIEVRRFGVGHRRASGGSPGDEGVTGRLIHSDARGVISELAFEPGGHIEPHSNPNTTYLIVIEGGGWTLVGDERIRVAAGEAVVWPPDEIHGAWTDYSHMRVFIVEFAGPDDSAVRGILTGRARELGPGESPASRADGELAPHAEPIVRDEAEGEPL
jgi:quercetin dioxygenase-like cupin family protein